MPIEPEPTPYDFGDPTDPPEDLVGIGADLAPGTVLSAYRHGLFPMPLEEGTLGWWSPVARGVLPLAGLRVTRSLRRAVAKFEIRVDSAFSTVIEACADPARPHGWIDDDIRDAYCDLHELGWAHSVECWRDGRMVGGLYGVAIGGLFAGESMFHRETDASKVALVALVDMLSDEYAEQRLLDVQWQTPHLASLGVVEVGREEYLDRVARVQHLPLPRAFA